MKKEIGIWYKVEIAHGLPEYDYFEMIDGKGGTYYHRQLKNDTSSN